MPTCVCIAYACVCVHACVCTCMDVPWSCSLTSHSRYSSSESPPSSSMIRHAPTTTPQTPSAAACCIIRLPSMPSGTATALGMQACMHARMHACTDSAM